MPLTTTEKIQIKQILKPPVDRTIEFAGILDLLVDADLLAAVRDSLFLFAEIRAARNPSQAGMTRADVVEWDSKSRTDALKHLESQIRCDLAIALGWVMDIDCSCGGIWF